MATNHAVYHRHLEKIRQIFSLIETRTKIHDYEVCFLASILITVFLGQLVAIGNTEVTSNYFTNKRNWVNVLFVKKGWFWTVLALLKLRVQHFISLLAKKPENDTQKSKGKAGDTEVPSNIAIESLHAHGYFALRVASATLYWILFTQWFFGPPIMDKIFTLTGGQCQYDAVTTMGDDGVAISSTVCRRKLKGSWVGGHDPSGHIFLLILSSILMFFEFVELEGYAGFVRCVKGLKRVATGEGLICEKIKGAGWIALQEPGSLVIFLLGLWWWMLLITSMYFHSFLEKATGLIAGLMGLAIYLGPRFSKYATSSPRVENESKTK